jgi:hypothetical protein
LNTLDKCLGERIKIMIAHIYWTLNYVPGTILPTLHVLTHLVLAAMPLLFISYTWKKAVAQIR